METAQNLGSDIFVRRGRVVQESLVETGNRARQVSNDELAPIWESTLNQTDHDQTINREPELRSWFANRRGDAPWEALSSSSIS